MNKYDFFRDIVIPRPVFTFHSFFIHSQKIDLVYHTVKYKIPGLKLLYFLRFLFAREIDSYFFKSLKTKLHINMIWLTFHTVIRSMPTYLNHFPCQKKNKFNDVMIHLCKKFVKILCNNVNHSGFFFLLYLHFVKSFQIAYIYDHVCTQANIIWW